MADAPNTSCYLVTQLDTGNLPANRLLSADADSNLQFLDSGPGGTYELTTTLRLASIVGMTGAGFMSFDGTNTITPRSLTSVNTITISNASGASGNPILEVINDTSKQKVGMQVNGNTPVGARANINFINGSNVTVAAVDNAGQNRLDVTVNAATGMSTNASVALLSSSENHSFNLGSLTTGLLKISVSGGIATPSTAIANTDYMVPTATLVQLSALTPGVGTLIVSNASSWTALAAGSVGQLLGITGGGVVGWVTSSASGAPANSTYLTQAGADLPNNGINLGATNAKLGIGTTTPAYPLDVRSTVLNSNSTYYLGASIICPNGAGYTGSKIDLTTYSGASVLALRSANGTLSSAATISSGNILGGVSAAGWDGTRFGPSGLGETLGFSAAILFRAGQSFTGSAQGTNVSVYTTPTNTISPVLSTLFNPDGTVTFNYQAILGAGASITGTIAGSPTFSGTPVLQNGANFFGNFGGNPTFTGSTIFLDTVTLNGALSSNATATFAGGVIFQNNVTLGSGNFNGSPTFTGNPTFSGAPSFSGGISVGALAVFSGGARFDAGATITAGTFGVASGVTTTFGNTPSFTNGFNMYGPSVGAIKTGAKVSFESGSTLELLSGSTFSLAGSITLSGGFTVPTGQTGTFASGSTLNAASGSTITLAGTINSAITQTYTGTTGFTQTVTGTRGILSVVDNSAINSFGQHNYTAYAGSSSVGMVLTYGSSRGSSGAQTATQSGDSFCIMYMGGGNGTTIKQATSIQGFATQTYTGSVNGSAIAFSTTPNGSSTLTPCFTLDQDGIAKTPFGLSITSAGTLTTASGATSTFNGGVFFNNGFQVNTGNCQIYQTGTVTLGDGTNARAINVANASSLNLQAGSTLSVLGTVTSAITQNASNVTSGYLSTVNNGASNQGAYTQLITVTGTSIVGSNIVIGMQKGTTGTPVPTQAGDIQSLIFSGYGNAIATGGSLTWLATETWSGTARGSSLDIRTVANGTTTNRAVMTFGQDGICTTPFGLATTGTGTLDVNGATFLRGATNISAATAMNNIMTVTNTNRIDFASGAQAKFAAGSTFRMDGGTYSIDASVTYTVSANATFGNQVTFQSGSSIVVDAGSLLTVNGTNRAVQASSTLWSTTCDARIKTDIVDIEDGLSVINKLRPRTYNYIQDYIDKHGLTQDMQYGFIADEVEEIMPECVTVTDVSLGEIENIKNLNMGPLTPLLFRAVQQLSAKIDALEAALEAAQAKIGA